MHDSASTELEQQKARLHQHQTQIASLSVESQEEITALRASLKDLRQKEVGGWVGGWGREVEVGSRWWVVGGRWSVVGGR